MTLRGDSVRPMRTRPVGDELSAEERAIVEHFDAATDAEESFRERMIDALHLSLDSLGLSEQVAARASEYLADAAIAVACTPVDGAR